MLINTARSLPIRSYDFQITMAKPSQLDLVYGLCKNKEFRSQWECLYNSTMMPVRIHCKDLFSDNIWYVFIHYKISTKIFELI